MDPIVAQFEKNFQTLLYSHASMNSDQLQELGHFYIEHRVIDAKNPQVLLFERIESLLTPLLWKQITTWDELRACMILYVRGRIPGSAEFPMPLYLDSQTQIKQFEQILRIGAITTDGHPGICNNTERQRAYIKCMVPNTDFDFELLAKTLDSRQTFIYSLQIDDEFLTNVQTMTTRWRRNKDRNFTDEYDQYVTVGKRSVEIDLSQEFEEGQWEWKSREAFKFYDYSNSKLLVDTAIPDIFLPKIAFLNLFAIDFCDVSILDSLRNLLTITRRKIPS